MGAADSNSVEPGRQLPGEARGACPARGGTRGGRGASGGLAWLVLWLAACGPEPVGGPVVRIERVHDLVGLFRTAEVDAGGAYPLRQLAHVDNEFDTRGAVAYLRAPPPSAIVFQGLVTHGRARLSFGCGAAVLTGTRFERPSQAVSVGAAEPQERGPLLGAVTLRPVIFRVEARDESLPDGVLETVFERTIVPKELVGPHLFERFEIDLPGAPGDPDAARTWTLRFSTSTAEELLVGQRFIAAWPGWFSPVLRSEGRAVALEDHPVPVVRVVRDLVATLGEAAVLRENEADPVVSDRLDAAEGVMVYGGRRAAVRAAPPSRVRFNVDVDDQFVFDFAVGVIPEQAWEASAGPPGRGVRFVVEVDGEPVWERVLDGHGEIADRGWKDGEVDLSRWAGERLALELITEAGAADGPAAAGGVPGNAGDTVGAWANPTLLRRAQVARRRAGQGPHVFVIVVDTLRADPIGCYGSELGLTPRLDALAQGGVVFTRARSVSSWTWPATASLLTGLPPHAHGVVGNGAWFLGDALDSVAELLNADGYTTGGFVANPLISRETNFDQGFETFVNTPSARGHALNERVGLWLDENEGTALFGYVHYYDPHSPYHPPPAFAGRAGAEPREIWLPPELRRQLTDAAAVGSPASPGLDDITRSVADNRRLYHDEVAAVDAAIGELLDDLQRRGLLEDALVIVTSDHGEEFFEHGMESHGHQLYEESVRVPLIVAGFGRSAVSPRRDGGSADVADILPTVLAATGLPGPEYALAGRSLLEDQRPRPVFAHTANGQEHGVPGFTEKLAVVLAPWKLIYTPASERVELYRLDADPAERHDIADEHPEQRDRMLASIEAWVAAARSQRSGSMPEMSDEASFWLRELGYVGEEDDDRR